MQTTERYDENDPNQLALALMIAAFEEGSESGVAPEQMAYAALFTALTDLVTTFGETAVIEMTRGLEKRISHGEFTIHRTRQ